MSARLSLDVSPVTDGDGEINARAPLELRNGSVAHLFLKLFSGRNAENEEVSMEL